jgi:hypothetical protein
VTPTTQLGGGNSTNSTTAKAGTVSADETFSSKDKPPGLEPAHASPNGDEDNNLDDKITQTTSGSSVGDADTIDSIVKGTETPKKQLVSNVQQPSLSETSEQQQLAGAKSQAITITAILGSILVVVGITFAAVMMHRSVKRRRERDERRKWFEVEAGDAGNASAENAGYAGIESLEDGPSQVNDGGALGEFGDFHEAPREHNHATVGYGQVKGGDLFEIGDPDDM